MEGREQFQQASARLYTVFARYPARRTMKACSCCVSREAIVALTMVPLRSLSAMDLERYCFKAMTTWGESEDFRYFLPRLLELCVVEPGSYAVNVDTICRKLAYAHWIEWPDEERQAILDYLLVFWQLLLESEPYHFKCLVGEYLKALSQILEDLSPFLRLWRQNEAAAALCALANFINESEDINGMSHWLSLLPGSSQAQQIIAWLLELETRQWLENGFFRSQESTFADELAKASDTLFFLKEAGW